MTAEAAVAGVLFILMLVFLVILLIIASVVFWIWMIVDCLTRRFDNDSDKIVWIIVLIFLHFFGAIIYYFVVKAKDKDIENTRQNKAKKK